MKSVFTKVKTEVGTLRMVSQGEILCGFEFETPERLALLNRRLTKYFPEAIFEEGQSEAFPQVTDWLGYYFEGRFESLPTIKLELRGTPFEKRVWALLRRLKPAGLVTYGSLARDLGTPNAARAVGGASRRNPISLIVPCHRVVGSGGHSTGYGGGLKNKEWLIAHEVENVRNENGLRKVRTEIGSRGRSLYL